MRSYLNYSSLKLFLTNDSLLDIYTCICIYTHIKLGYIQDLGLLEHFIHSPGHQKGKSYEAQGNGRAGHAAKVAALATIN